MANRLNQQELVQDVRGNMPVFAGVAVRQAESPEHKAIENRISNNPQIKRFIERYSDLMTVRNIIYDIIYVHNYSMVNPVHIMIAAYLYLRMDDIKDGITNEVIYDHVVQYFYDPQHNLYRFIQINKENKESYYSRYQLRLFRYLKLLIQVISKVKIADDA